MSGSMDPRARLDSLRARNLLSLDQYLTEIEQLETEQGDLGAAAAGAVAADDGGLGGSSVASDSDEEDEEESDLSDGQLSFRHVTQLSLMRARVCAAEVDVRGAADDIACRYYPSSALVTLQR